MCIRDRCSTGCADHICDSKCWNCSCTKGSTATCDQRVNCCNAFRYGQCNTQVKGTTPIACRVITCVNPASIPGFRCNGTYLEDNNTCGHDVPCLTEKKAGILGKNPGA